MSAANSNFSVDTYASVMDSLKNRELDLYVYQYVTEEDYLSVLYFFLLLWLAPPKEEP